MDFSVTNVICKEIKDVSNIAITHLLPTGIPIFIQLRQIKDLVTIFNEGEDKMERR